MIEAEKQKCRCGYSYVGNFQGDWAQFPGRTTNVYNGNIETGKVFHQQVYNSTWMSGLANKEVYNNEWHYTKKCKYVVTHHTQGISR